jgi:glutathione S-transferase
MSKPIIGYWRIRGLAEPIRHILAYAKVDFDDVTYEQGDGPEFSRESWLGVKHTVGLPFPNLPYFIDGDVKITESSAIIRHVVRKYAPALLGTDEVEAANADMLFGIVGDIKSLLGFAYRPDFEALKPSTLAKVSASLTPIASWLSERPFLAGGHISYVDFFFVELLQLIDAMEPGTSGSVSEVFAQYTGRFRETVDTEDFYNKPRLPFNNKVAYFGGGFR